MGIFKFLKRGGKVVEAHANNALDKLEAKNPVVVAEQAIRDMKEQLEKVSKAQTKVKAQANKLKAEQVRLEDESKEWMSKAKKLKAKLTGEEENDAAIKESIIGCLNKVENLNNEAATKKTFADNTSKKADDLGKKVKKYKQDIEDAKSTLEDLKTRSTVAKAEKELNKEMSDLDDDSAFSALERMKNVVIEDEAEADAYSEMTNESQSLEDKINEQLEKDSPTENDKLLNDFLAD